MNLSLGRRAEGPNDRMEAELSAWLRSLEPAGVPIALRVRTFADLRAEAERPRPRFARLVPALSATARLGLTVAGLGLLALLAVGGAASWVAGGLSSIVDLGPGPTPPPGQAAPFTYDPADLQTLVLAACLAGLAVLAPPVRTAATWLALGRTPVPPAPPLPFRRPWRTIPRLTWLVAGLTMLTLWMVVRVGPFGAPNFPTANPVELGDSISYWAEFPLTFLALAVAWRYPRHDRSGRLLLLGATLAVSMELFSMLVVLMTDSASNTPEIIQILVFAGLVSLACMVAGVAGRSGAVRRPPAWLAGLSVGVAFGLTLYMAFAGLFGGAQVPWMFYLPLTGIQNSLIAVAWLAMAWVSLSALRRHRSWPWALMLIAAAFTLGALSLHEVLVAIARTPPAFGDEALWIEVERLAYLAMEALSGLATVAFLAALLAGLGPAPARAKQSEPPRER